VAKARHEEALICAYIRVYTMYIQYVYAYIICIYSMDTRIQYVYTVCKAWCNAECSVVAKACHQKVLIYAYIRYTLCIHLVKAECRLRYISVYTLQIKRIHYKRIHKRLHYRQIHTRINHQPIHNKRMHKRIHMHTILV
jgi:hypothetical protein